MLLLMAQIIIENLFLDRLSLVDKAKGQAKKGKRKEGQIDINDREKTRGKRAGVSKGGKGDTAEARVQQELQKVMMVQARMAKRGQKMKKLRSTFDTVEKNGDAKCKLYIKININLLFLL